MRTKIQNAIYIRGHLLSRMMTGEGASIAVEEILCEAGCSMEEMREFWTSPEISMGPFMELPPEVKDGLAEAALFSFLEGHSLSSPLLESTVHGSRTRIGFKLVKLGWILIHRMKFKVGKIFVRLGRRLVKSARIRGVEQLSEIRFTDRYDMPLIFALWKLCGCDVLELIQDYIEDIPIDRRICPIWKDEVNNSESCMIIGVDTVMHEGAVYFVESNINPGFHADRLSVYPEGDPFCRNLVDYASENGYSKIVFFPANVAADYIDTSYLMEVELEEAWRGMAAQKSIELEVIDCPVLGSPYKRSAELYMPVDARDTLFVNVRDLHSPLSRLLGTKGEFETRLEHRNKRVPEKEQVKLPAQILNNSELHRPDRTPRFPNLIVKDTRVDMGKGIFMYKCDTLPANANAGTRQAFEYVVPDLVSQDVDGQSRDFVAVFRAHIMLRHDGAGYLATRKDISSVPVPASLEMGPVVNKNGYISNLHLGSYTVQASVEEASAHKRFSQSVGASLHELMLKKYRKLTATTPRVNDGI